MRHSIRTALFTLIASAPLAAAGAAAEAACPEGETKFRNGVFYTCTCYSGSNGQKTCFWKAD